MRSARLMLRGAPLIPVPPGDWDDKSCLSEADGLPLLRLPFISVNAQQEGVLHKYRDTPSFPISFNIDRRGVDLE